MKEYRLNNEGLEIQELLNQIKNKTIYGNATRDTAGLMSAEDKDTLDTLVDNVGENIQQLNNLNQAVSENTTAIETNTGNIATNTSAISTLNTTTGNLGTRLDAAEETLDNIFQLDANNFMGIYDAAANLPAMTGAGWALVGQDLTALLAYVYNIPQAQWQQYGTTTYDYSDYSGLATQVATIGLEIDEINFLNGGYSTDSDLDVTDSNGYVIARFENGHIETKNFDSSDAVSQIDEINSLNGRYNTESDLDITDPNGYVIARFEDGHIKTKYFDSSSQPSSFEDYIRETHITYNVDCGNTIPNDYATEVSINTYTQKTIYQDNAVLYLPTTYTQGGTPTKLIIYCKHGASEIDDTQDPILGSIDKNVFNYMLALGYAILGADGVPNGYASAIGICERVVGNYIAVQSTRKAYEYVIKHFNIDRNGAFIYGYSQGGHYAQNVIDLSGIPILCAAEVSPVCSMRYHQWDLATSGTIGGVSWTKLARLNIARLFGYPSVSTDAELLALEYDQNKVQGYDPYTRNVENPYDGFTQSGTLWTLPSGTSLADITMKKHLKCPLKIWCAKNDNKLGADVMKVFIQAAKNAGCVADLRIYSTGGHSIQSSQTAIGTFTQNGGTFNLYPLAYEIGAWFSKFGGNDLIN